MTSPEPPDDRPERPELAALADGSLDPERADSLRREVAGSDELARALDEQARAANIVRTAAADVEAPLGLRERLDQDRTTRAAKSRRGWAIAAGFAGSAAVVAVGLVLVLPGGASDPSVTAAVTLATRPAAVGAPAAASPTLLAEEVDGVPFPNWDREFAFDATGSRQDSLDDRATTTVFYDRNGSEVAYTIVSGEALPPPDGAARRERNGVEMRVFTEDGRSVVTWERDGHTCVLSSTEVDGEVLSDLAVWMGSGTVPF